MEESIEFCADKSVSDYVREREKKMSSIGDFFQIYIDKVNRESLNEDSR